MYFKQSKLTILIAKLSKYVTYITCTVLHRRNDNDQIYTYDCDDDQVNDTENVFQSQEDTGDAIAKVVLVCLPNLKGFNAKQLLQCLMCEQKYSLLSDIL